MAPRTGPIGSWSLPLPELLPPATLYFQDWIFNGPLFESTHRMTVSLLAR